MASTIAKFRQSCLNAGSYVGLPDYLEAKTNQYQVFHTWAWLITSRSIKI